MSKFTFMTVAALALALAAGSAQAAGKLGGASGMDRAGDDRAAGAQHDSLSREGSIHAYGGAAGGIVGTRK